MAKFLGFQHGRLLAMQVGVLVLQQLLGVVGGQPELVQIETGHSELA